MELEQFCALASSQKGIGCSAIIQQVLNSKKIFTFSELFSVPSIAEMQTGEFEKYYKTLHLFAYGSYEDYIASPSSFIDLTEFQKHKLKQLTLASIASEARTLHYEYLLQVLVVDNIRALEELILDSINLGLIEGKIDQKNKVLLVSDFMGRDVRVEHVDNLIDVLERWRDRCDLALVALQESSHVMRSHNEKSANEQSNAQKAADETKKILQEQGEDEGEYPGMRHKSYSFLGAGAGGGNRAKRNRVGAAVKSGERK